jgi:hypothetical protein
MIRFSLSPILRAAVCALAFAATVAAQQAPAAVSPRQSVKKLSASALPSGYALAAPASRGVELEALSTKELEGPRKPGPLQIGVRRAVPPGVVRRQAVETMLATGRKIWRVGVRSPGAVGLRVHFTGFAAGAGRVWVYANGGVLGPYTGAGPHGDGAFWSGAVESDSATVEYEPAAGATVTAPPFEIDAVTHEWQSPLAGSAGPASATAASCELDVSCYAAYSSQATAVVRYTFVAADGTGSYVCSGALLNTTASSFKPYVLSANHCIGSASEAQSAIAYFQYQTDSCNGNTPSLYGVPRVEGAQYLAGAGIAEGDYSFFLLSGDAPGGTLFLGWNAEGPAVGGNIVTIHHPRGSFKRISFGHRAGDRDVSIDGVHAPASRYYQIRYDNGVTESGSSGSPVMNMSSQVVATTSAGPAVDSPEEVCTIAVTDTCGRFSNAYPAVKQWLEEEPVSCSAAPAAGDWKGEYFSNTTLTGAPAMVRDDGANMLSFVWGANSPAASCGLPADGFSVRWTRTLTLEAGRYRFVTMADDGVRLYIDGALKIDEWKTQAATEHVIELDLEAGSHTLVMEYYDVGGVAVAKLSWARQTSCTNVVEDGRWRGEYFNNTTLTGSPVMVRDDGASGFAFDWGVGSPAASCGVPVDGFSARWTRTFPFSAGRYRFKATADDGVRLWIDGALKIDEWREQAPSQYAVNVELTAGYHTVVMEYYEAASGAIAKLSWEALPSCTALVALEKWKGEYFNNMTFSGDPVLVRDDGAGELAFDWGFASPDSVCEVPADGFSVRWTRTALFTAGRYRFKVTGDDGVRLAIDGTVVIDQWRDQAPMEYTADVDLTPGSHKLVLEYYENGAGAVARLSWGCAAADCGSTPAISGVTLRGDLGNGFLYTLTGGFDFIDGGGDIEAVLPCADDTRCAWLHIETDPPSACDVRWAAPFLNRPGETSGHIEINLQYSPRVTYWGTPGNLAVKVSVIDKAGRESNVVRAEPAGPDGNLIYACPITPTTVEDPVKPQKWVEATEFRATPRATPSGSLPERSRWFSRDPR